MGNCLPVLFGGLDRNNTTDSDTAPLQHRRDSSNADESTVRNDSMPSSTQRQASNSRQDHAQVSAYVNELLAAQDRAADQRFEEDTRMARKLGLLDQLPTDVYVSGGKTDKECAICMVEFIEGDRIRYLPCLHSYHLDCVNDWLLRSFTCPSCMEPVDSALLSSFTAHNAIDLASLSVSPARFGPPSESEA